jgi:hypothetical protein
LYAITLIREIIELTAVSVFDDRRCLNLFWRFNEVRSRQHSLLRATNQNPNPNPEKMPGFTSPRTATLAAANCCGENVPVGTLRIPVPIRTDGMGGLYGAIGNPGRHHD